MPPTSADLAQAEKNPGHAYSGPPYYIIYNAGGPTIPERPQRSGRVRAYARVK